MVWAVAIRTMHNPAVTGFTSPVAETEQVAPLSDSKEINPPDEPRDDSAEIVSDLPATRTDTGASTVKDWLALFIVMDISVDPGW